MITLTFTIKSLINLSVFMNIFMDGGPLFMSLILICLLVSIAFLVLGFSKINKASEKSAKLLKLAADSSLLGLVMGFLGSVLGLISAFDSVQALGEPDPAIFAGGLRVSLLTATFGLFTFVVARIGILILRSFLSSESKIE
ncbi:MotA/TolQ/ExbB proton channel family protein [Psychroserpens mesophilus]|uniref:MotA/TolQ/ExbB proton channel family protein n=1 Tax=Psychroserpens mesophilus TaxID=325473 RepID=UPI00058C7E95|nr:MotA/TolQ/ExbB proton channel family protein [Psychroserpens mesophilus]